MSNSFGPPALTLDQALIKKSELETAIHNLLNQYQDVTGLTPSAVVINTVPYRHLDGSGSVRISQVRVTVELP